MPHLLLFTILLSSVAPSAPSGEDPAVGADRYEARYRETGDPQDLWKAAKAHSNAGRDARAIVCWRRALAAGLTGADAVAIRASLHEARRRTAPLTLRVSPGEPPGEALLELSRSGDAAPLTVRLAQLRDAEAAPLTLHVEPGEWQLRLVPDAAYNAASATLLVDTLAPQTVDPARTPAEHRVRFTLAAGGPTSVALTLTHAADPTRTHWQRHLRGRRRRSTRRPHARRTRAAAGRDAVAADHAARAAAPRERKILGSSVLGVAAASAAIGTGFLVWGARRGFACADTDSTCQYALDSVGGVSVGSASAVNLLVLRRSARRRVMRTVK